MKSSELRIGNYVRIKNTSDIVRVSAITKRKIGFHAPNERPDAHLRYRRLDEIEPVLIYEVYHSLPHIHALMWADKVLCEDLYYYNGLPITDLHELQNIHYALTGNKIEIEI